mmetsp:Transcript_82979/g.201272  ORF Transcript_82979/g.201272 Transcript_82979/m.201272 type:complete len:253 (+) Transcript_82979:34-792(+)
MSNVFEHYEADYHSSTRTAAQNIEKLPDLLPGHEKAELTNATAKAIDAAEDIVKQMELEARSLQGEERQTAVAQAKDYKASISVLKEQLKLAKNSNRAEEAARAQLFQQSNPAHMAESETQRSRLLAANSKMGKASDKLKAACQIAVDTEQVGTDILTDLNTQRQTIQGARNRLSGANTNLDRSRRLLNGMANRARKNKVIMVFIIIVLIILIALIIYLNYFYTTPEPSPPSPPAPPPPPRPPPPPDVLERR